MELIRIYDKNSNEYKKLEFACAVFNGNGFECYVENTWFDYGQKWDYTAILCKSDWECISIPKSKRVFRNYKIRF